MLFGGFVVAVRAQKFTRRFWMARCWRGVCLVVHAQCTVPRTILQASRVSADHLVQIHTLRSQRRCQPVSAGKDLLNLL
jgi:hypothetical protein